MSGSGIVGSIVFDDQATTPYDDIVICSNNFNGHVTGDLAMHLQYAPAPGSWASDDNCFDLDASYVWDHRVPTGFAAWQTNSQGDPSSTTSSLCTTVPPVFSSASPCGK